MNEKDDLKQDIGNAISQIEQKPDLSKNKVLLNYLIDVLLKALKFIERSK